MAPVPPDPPIPSLLFRPAAQWLLLAAGAVVVGWFVGLTVWGLAATRLGVPVPGPLGLAFIFLVPFLPALVFSRCAVRMDEEGIWRRRFFRWDLWPWTAFAEGKIEDALGADCFLFPEKPWHGRRLNLGVLPERNRRLIRDQIRRFRQWREIRLPEEVTINFDWRRHARFTPAGVYLWRARKEPRFVGWSEVGPIKLRRLDHDRRDFRWLLFRPAGSHWHIVLLHGGEKSYWQHPASKFFAVGGTRWRGASAEVLAAFLEKHVPPEQLHIDALRGAPASLAECERRLAEIEKNYSQTKRLAPWMKVLTLLWLTWIGMTIQNGPNRGMDLRVYKLISFVVFVGGFLLYWKMHRDYKKEKNALEAFSEALPKESNCPLAETGSP
jgi:hypothetical protein